MAIMIYSPGLGLNDIVISQSYVHNPESQTANKLWHIMRSQGLIMICKTIITSYIVHAIFVLYCGDKKNQFRYRNIIFILREVRD